MGSAALKLVVSQRESTGPLDSPWGIDLAKIETRIKDGEAASIKARWESGRQLLKMRKGKKLPPGLLDESAATLGVNRVELQRRTRLYERFQTDDELCHAVTQWPTWHSMVRDGLVIKRAAPKAKPPARVAEFRTWIRRLRDTKPADLSVKDLETLEEMRDEIDRILKDED